MDYFYTWNGWEINNIDSVLIAERPKISPHVKLMNNKISEILNFSDVSKLNLLSFVWCERVP